MIITNRLINEFHQVSGIFAELFSEDLIESFTLAAELKRVSVLGFGGLVIKTLTPGNTAPDPLNIKSVLAFN